MTPAQLRRQARIEAIKRPRHCRSCGALVGYFTGPLTNAVWHDVGDQEHPSQCAHAHSYYYCPDCCPGSGR